MNRYFIIGMFFLFISLEGGYFETIINKSNMEFQDCTGESIVINFLKQELTVIMVFSDQCLTCNKNIPIWNKISSLSEVHAIGITFQLQGDTEDVLKFPLLKPMDVNVFKSFFQVRDGVDYTIAIKDGVIVYNQIGQLVPTDFFNIKQLVKK